MLEMSASESNGQVQMINKTSNLAALSLGVYPGWTALGKKGSFKAERVMTHLRHRQILSAPLDAQTNYVSLKDLTRTQYLHELNNYKHEQDSGCPMQV